MKLPAGLIAIVLLFSLAFCYAPQSQRKVRSESGIRIAYIGNMGVLVASDTQAVLFDGLHEFYGKEYDYPSEKTFQQLQEGNYQGFPKVKALFYSHMHGDHFSPALTHAFLKANPTTCLFGSSQILDTLAVLDSLNTLQNQLDSIPFDEQVHVIEPNGFELEGFALPHASPGRHIEILNIGFLVDLDGFRLLHLGDTDWEEAEPKLEAFAIAKRQIDVAIIPYWMLLKTGSAALVDRLINPKMLLATHIPPDASEEDLKEIESQYPGCNALHEQNNILAFPVK
jgi:L-ascorbate metabolism protein UlaG (beta-lactamase superfamily)